MSILFEGEIIHTENSVESDRFRREYYSCLNCHLVFKDLRGAVEHKLNSLHRIIKKYFPEKSYHSFPPFELRIKGEHLSEISQRSVFPVEALDELPKNRKLYRCSVCGLRFKNKMDANRHSVNTGHKIVLELNHKKVDFWPFNKPLQEIIGSNIDYEAFCQRAVEMVPYED